MVRFGFLYIQFGRLLCSSVLICLRLCLWLLQGMLKWQLLKIFFSVWCRLLFGWQVWVQGVWVWVCSEGWVVCMNIVLLLMLLWLNSLQKIELNQVLVSLLFSCRLICVMQVFLMIGQCFMFSSLLLVSFVCSLVIVLVIFFLQRLICCVEVCCVFCYCVCLKWVWVLLVILWNCFW